MSRLTPEQVRRERDKTDESNVWLLYEPPDVVPYYGWNLYRWLAQKPVYWRVSVRYLRSNVKASQWRKQSL